MRSRDDATDRSLRVVDPLGFLCPQNILSISIIHHSCTAASVVCHSARQNTVYNRVDRTPICEQWSGLREPPFASKNDLLSSLTLAFILSFVSVLSASFLSARG